MAIKGNRYGIEFYIKIIELRLKDVTKEGVKTTFCTYQTAIYKEKTMADLDDSNAIKKLDFLTFELSNGNNFYQQAYAHLIDHLGNDYIEDVN